MSDMNRRDFVRTSVWAGVAAGAAQPIFGQAPAVARGSVRPVVIASGFNVNFYVLNARGEHAGVALYGGPNATYAVCTENGPQNRPIEPLLPGNPND